MDRREGLPSIQTLGLDLLITNRFQRWQPIAMPAIWAACFMLAWHWGFFVLSFASLVLAFSASSTSTHDVLHGSLGLKRIQTEWLLFMLGAPILESGHAYRLTHLEHHRSFPSDDDIEGEAAHMPVWRVLLAGPTFLPRLWIWAWRKSHGLPRQRRWLVIEALLPVFGLVAGRLALPWTSSILAYVVTVMISSCFYPLFAVHLPHRHFEDSRLKQAWTLRGRLIPRLFRPLAFHLEHHLYPMVPSHNLPLLAERLEPYLLSQGVRLLHMP